MTVLPFICSMPDGSTVDNVHLLDLKDPECQYYSNSSKQWIRIGNTFELEQDVKEIIAMYSMKNEANKATSLRALQMACRWAAVSGKFNYMATIVYSACNIYDKVTADKANMFIETLKAAGEYARIKAGLWLDMHFQIPVAVTYLTERKYSWQKEWAQSCTKGEDGKHIAVPYKGTRLNWESQQFMIVFNSFYHGDTTSERAPVQA